MKRITNILLVEDDFADEIDVRKTLDKRGVLYHMRAARSAEEALAVIEELRLKPDIILADGDLPGVNGFELAEKLKANPKYANIKVFVLASASMMQSGEAVTNKNVSGVIEKPLRFDQPGSKGAFHLMIDLINAG